MGLDRLGDCADLVHLEQEKRRSKTGNLNLKGLRQEVQNTNLQEESVACLLLDSSGNSVINLVIFMPKMPLNWFHLLRVAIKNPS